MRRSYVIIDSANQIYLDSLDISDVFRSGNGDIPFRVVKRRLSGGVQDGVDIVEIDSGRFSMTALLTRGMNILKARCDDVELKWDSPVQGVVHPKYVPLFAPGGCGWLEGFSEWVARCGLESNGAPEFDEKGVLKYPLHGRLSNLPARYVELAIDTDAGVIQLSGRIFETSVFGRRFVMNATYTIPIGGAGVVVEDTVENQASVDDEFELLYHINTGYPLVSPGSKFYAPFGYMCPRDSNAALELPQWDRFREPKPGCAETCYFFDLAADEKGETRVALVNEDETKGLTLSFNKADFPYFILWKTQRPNGDIYVSGIEPAINFPNTRSFEKSKGRVASIAAKGKKTFRFVLKGMSTSDSVKETIAAISRLQNGVDRKIADAPNPDWCE